MRETHRIVFMGDSITDAGRDRHSPRDLGNGYVRDIARCIEASGIAATIWNRGIGGDRATDVDARWDQDCLAMEPNIISLLVGVNDTWRGFDRNEPTPPERYGATIDSLLTRTGARELPEGPSRVILVEPFELVVGHVTDAWTEEMDARRTAIRELADVHNATLVAMAQTFRDAAAQSAPEAYLFDGVHPTSAGHELIASQWMSAARPLLELR